MKRACMKFLSEWLVDPFRKPLVIRGARQVGKTWIVRQLAEIHEKKLIEINFEDRPDYASLFSSNDPIKILERIRNALKIDDIDVKEALLFLDEIQVAPELFAKLRWFKEKMPELPVIATGSLLELVLDRHSMSMPVGRVSFMYLEPFSFEEFLHAKGEVGLVRTIREYTWQEDMPTLLHDDLMGLFKEYVLVGGMPDAIAIWKDTGSLSKVSNVHNDIMSTYRTDFTKYDKVDPMILNDVIKSVPLQLNKKFMYSSVNRKVNPQVIKKAFDLLCQARLCHKVQATAANGLPLGGGVRHRFFKAIFLDVGLCSASLGLLMDYAENVDTLELELVNKGGIAEQVVGQLLRTIEPLYKDPELFYWLRNKEGSDAEVDYVIQDRSKVLPIEVKAGTSGALKSLHLFMRSKKLSHAVQVYGAAPSQFEVSVKTTEGHPVKYQLASIPFYLVGQLPRLLNQIR